MVGDDVSATAHFGKRCTSWLLLGERLRRASIDCCVVDVESKIDRMIDALIQVSCADGPFFVRHE
jgi:hypothetical protein